MVEGAGVVGVVTDVVVVGVPEPAPEQAATNKRRIGRLRFIRAHDLMVTG